MTEQTPPREEISALPAGTHGATIDVVIPAFNEQDSLPLVLAGLFALESEPGKDHWTGAIRRVVVADNNSSDDTALVARQAGAHVIEAKRQGYGSACLAALAEISSSPPDIVVFIDADFSDHPEELPSLVEPLLEDRADLVIGSRTLGKREPGALLPQARFGNLLACFLIRVIYGHVYTDLGPFRAIRWQSLERLQMRDPDFGWTAEMQVKALRHSLRVVDVPVSYRRRIGVSKITGTVIGTLRAGHKILWTVFRYGFGKPENQRE